MNTRERMKKYLQYKNISEGTFEKSTGLSKGFISNIGDSIRAANRLKIEMYAPDLNMVWLLTGEGNMLNNKESPPLSPVNTIINDNNDSLCDYITYLLPMSTHGGSFTGIPAEATQLQGCEKIISPIKGVDFAISIYGDSMAPEYPSGSRVLIKKINPEVFIDWGRVYVLDTSNGVIIKKVIKSNTEGYVTCRSVNPDPIYSDFDVPLKEIYGMYRVLMCLSAK